MPESLTRYTSSQAGNRITCLVARHAGIFAALLVYECQQPIQLSIILSYAGDVGPLHILDLQAKAHDKISR